VFALKVGDTLLQQSDSAALSFIQKKLGQFFPGYDRDWPLRRYLHGVPIAEVNRDLFDVLAWKITGENVESINCPPGDTAAARFFPGRLRVEECHGVPAPGE
jgi:hypothetical protein